MYVVCVRVGIPLSLLVIKMACHLLKFKDLEKISFKMMGIQHVTGMPQRVRETPYPKVITVSTSS